MSHKDQIRFETSLRILLLLEQNQGTISFTKALCVDFIARNPTIFDIEGRTLEGTNPMVFSQFISSTNIFRSASIDLKARNLIDIQVDDNDMNLTLQATGKNIAKQLTSTLAAEYRTQIKTVLNQYEDKSSEDLMKLINLSAARTNI